MVLKPWLWKKIIKLTLEERKVMGEKGRSLLLKEFDEKIVIAKYLEIINKLYNA